jgi:hypothetical protein
MEIEYDRIYVIEKKEFVPIVSLRYLTCLGSFNCKQPSQSSRCSLLSALRTPLPPYKVSALLDLGTRNQCAGSLLGDSLKNTREDSRRRISRTVLYLLRRGSSLSFVESTILFFLRECLKFRALVPDLGGPIVYLC